MKKRALSLLMVLVMVISLLPATARAADSTLSGDISVGTPAELAALGGKDIDGNITLTDDIDMSGTAMTPIKSLKGCFNGNSKTISNLSLVGDSASGYGNYVTTGLIGELDGSVINLKISNISITNIGNNNQVGALAGRIKDNSKSQINNCIVEGKTTSEKGNTQTLIGGLVGRIGDESEVIIKNCIVDVEITGNGNYVGGIIGQALNAVISIQNSAILKNITNSSRSSGCATGVIGNTNDATTLKISNCYTSGKISGKNNFGITYNMFELKSISCDHFYYDSTKNPSDYLSTFYMLKKGENSISSGVTGKSTSDLVNLKLDGFAVRDGEFDGYPVPVWMPAAVPEPITPPAPAFSCDLTFTGVENGTLTVNDSGGKALTTTNGVYTLSAAGNYTYSVTFDENSIYNNIEDTEFTVNGDETAKTIKVTLTYKTAKPEGDGTEKSPILIGTAAELRYFAEQVNNGKLSNAYVVLENDIEVPGSWTPLGKNAAFPFSGHFDGNGHSVTITVDNPGLSYFGFFGCLDSQPDRDSTTSIDDQPTVVVENLTVNGSIYCSEPGAFVGGIAARACGKVSIENCVNNATVSSLARASAGVGGLIGGYDDGVEYVYKNIRMTVDGCKNNGTINVTGTNTDAKVGGLVGSNANCVQVSKSTNTGTINAPGCTVGGLLGEAGYQTGDFKPTIQDSSNTGTLIGAEGKTNNLYGKGNISSGNVTGSGNNKYTGGSESEDELLVESQKYNDVLAGPAGARENYEITLLKSGKTADEDITVTCSVGERDTNRDYLKVVDGKLQLVQPNTSRKVIEATATITWSKDGKTLSKPVAVNIYPAADSRKTLMDNIAATYTNSSSDWVVFDMAAYAKLDNTKPKTSDEAKTNYLNLTTNELAGTSPLVSDRAKAEIILAALGVDSIKLKTVDGTEYSNAAKLADMNLGSSHYTAPWVLLAEQAGQVKLTDAQRANMISLLTDSTNLGKDGLFFTKWAGETFADPDTTGTALAALAKYNTSEYPKVQTFVNKAVEGLSKAQNSNGSFGNVNSDAMVIIGLTAIGIDPAADSRFVKGGCSLADAPLLYVNDDKNGFTVGYISGTQGEKAQALATEQGFRALVALEKFDSLRGDSKSFNIYTQTAKTSQSGNTTVITPNKPNTGYESNNVGSVPSTGSGSVGGSTNNWISVVLSITPGDNSQWYQGSLRLEKDATVEQAIRSAAESAGLTLDIKDGYLRSITRNGDTLGQYDEGSNSGWMYKVNGKAPNVGIADYKLTGGETISLYYTADYTKEDDMDISAPAAGGNTAQTDAPLPFVDVDKSEWYYTAVQYAYENGLFSGTSATTFAPEDTLSRSMVVSVLYRLSGSPSVTDSRSFSDVSSGLWYTDAVNWAAGTSVIDGVGDNRFAPESDITREQLATILYRYAKNMHLTDANDTELSRFKDADTVSDWAAEAMVWAVANGLISGTSDTTLSPKDTATRAQFAQIMYQFSALAAQK